LYLEALESRQLLSAALPGFTVRRGPLKAAAPPAIAHSTLARPQLPSAIPSATTPGANWFTPEQLRRAYGMDQITFGSVTGDGSGQTIALIVAYHYPTALADLNAFSSYYNLPSLAPYTDAGMTTPYFRQVSQTGGTNYPATDPSGPGNGITWSMEAALDIQWAHAMAPGANIVLVEANSPAYTDLVSTGVNWARNQPGVSVVSMSFGSSEFGGQDLFDSYFTTPSGHGGVTFISSTGDFGSPAQFPATSNKVVGVGGTSLMIDSFGNYISETGWNGSGGGISTQVSRPSYQSGISLSSMRMSPDVSLVSDPNTGVAVYNSYDYGGSPWFVIGGTSLAAPMFGGIMAVANQGRAMVGLPSLDGATGTLPKLYTLPAEDFHDVTWGSNGGFAAGPGYDLVTGLGTPVGNELVNDLIGSIGSISGRAYSDANGNGIFDAGDAAQSGISIYLDTNGNSLLDTGGTQTLSSGTINFSIPNANANGTTSTMTMAGMGGLVSKVTVQLNISHTRDQELTAYLIGPDNTQVLLFDKVGGMGDNFANTIFSDSAATHIALGSAPFNGTYKPAGQLANFNGKAANGLWRLKVVDSVAGTSGTLNSWSVAVTTDSEKFTLTGTDGTYTFGPVLGGTYAVREVVPAGYSQAAPTSANMNISGPMTGVDFVNLRSTFTAASTLNSYYLWLSAAKLHVGTSPGVPLQQYALATAPNLKFNLTSGTRLTLDFAGGPPLPPQGILVNGGGVADSELLVLGAGGTLTLTDTKIGDATGVVSYQGLGTMILRDSVINYSGNLSTLSNLVVDTGTVLYWN
jgi:subtilisin-like proprotein convertase family protein